MQQITQQMLQHVKRKIERHDRAASYIRRHKAVDLLKPRPSIATLHEQLAQGKKVPGLRVEPNQE